ncbi:hypothetical protein GBA52_008618 [Prunus armeniaca]|nr:hypothetical protein GBA52_008618 [Prunus armeniaca]
MAESLKQKGTNYSIDEDVALCRAWIIISEDPIIENCQSNQFIQFHPDAQEVRSSQSLKSRWTNISQMCNKFSKCLAQVARLNKSVQNEIDNKLKRPHKPQTHDEGLWDTKKAKELKRKTVVEESSQDDKELKEIMRS